MKNVNTEIIKYQREILDLYETIKNRTNLDESSFGSDFNNYNGSDEQPQEEGGNDAVDNLDQEKEQTKVRRRRSFNDVDLENEVIWNQFTGADIRAMMPNDMFITDDKYHAINKVMNCKFSLGLDQNLEFYFSSNEKLNSKMFFENFFSNHSDNTKSKSSSSLIKQV